jgi:hypothetical protein
MTQTADNADEQQQLPEDQAPSSAEGSSPETVAADREREIQRHLSQQGRELADARRRAEAASQLASAQAGRIGDLEANIRLMAEHLNEQQRQQAQARQAQMEAELASLPPQDRLERKLDLLQGQVNDMRTAVPQAQPARAQPAPAAPQPPPGAGQQQQEDPAEYMERRVKEIQQEAQSEFGVLVTADEIPDDAWGTEDAFYKSVMKLAAQKSATGGEDMPKAKAAETQEQMRDRIRREEREKLGVNAPAAARATPSSARKKTATDADVRAQVQSYNSATGPKGNIAKLKELRESMG